MNTQVPQMAAYALPPRTPALQADPARWHRSLAISALALFCLALSLGYLIGRSRPADSVFTETSTPR